MESSSAQSTSSIKWEVLITVVILLIAILYSPVKRSIQKAVTYDKAVTAISQGEYDEALSLFHDIRGSYRYKEELIYYCQAVKNYERGWYESAHNMLGHITSLDAVDRHLPGVAANAERIEARYQRELPAIRAAQARAEKERKEQELEKIRSDVPFEGMSEIYISETILGRYDRVESERAYSSLVRGPSQQNTYYFYNSHDVTMFEVTCLDGKVIRVRDYRRTHGYHSKHYRGDDSAADSSSYYIYSYSYDDGYDASNSLDAEDFYYDNEDLFDSFEDAEDYWDEHYG